MDKRKKSNKGFSSILAVIFVTLFSVLAISFTALSNINVQMSQNHRDVAIAQAAAESGLAYARHLIQTYVPPEAAYSIYNTVSDTEAEQTFAYFAAHVETVLGSGNVSWDGANGLLQIPAGGGIALPVSGSAASFSLLCEFETDPHYLVVTSTGTADGVNRTVRLKFPIRKDNKVLSYALASRGRMWLTGDTTIQGDIFSAWNRPEISPFNMTDDSSVIGTINTVLTRESIENEGYQMETLNEDGDPVDALGNPLGNNYDDRYYSPDDEIQGYHEGINYDVPYNDMPGMDISDYNTDEYMNGLTDIPSCPSEDREVEYFPHASGNYNQPSSGGSLQLERHVYENQTFTDVRLPDNRNALFRNCTFEGKLYIDCYKSGSSKYNNVRFEDCDFNGVIVTDVPQVFKWQYNCLYFTGAATFNNTAMAEATILAPHFNVNLGNTNPIASDNNVLTGAIVGGIVDIRGNAEIYGTVLSMCDTTQWSSGYVTNIGATLGDGGSETTELGDIGTITINPDQEKMLPSGIKTPIVIGGADGESYVEL